MYRVYMIERRETGQVYIGMTKQTMNKRLGDHLGASKSDTQQSNCALHDLLREDKIQNVKEFRELYNMVILKDHLETKEDAAFYEKSYISFYDEVQEEAIVVNKRKPEKGYWIIAMLNEEGATNGNIKL